jgi:hypothetical protein
VQLWLTASDATLARPMAIGNHHPAGLCHHRIAPPLILDGERRGPSRFCRKGVKHQALLDRIFVWPLMRGILIALIVALHIAGALYPCHVKGDRVRQ